MENIPQVLQRGVRSQAQSGDIGWDDIRLFLAVVECGSIRAAAARTRQTFKTVKRRLQVLEGQIGAALVMLSPRGVELTDVGEKVRETGLEMMRPLHRLNDISIRQRGLRSTVRVGATEGLGSFWLVPRVIDFYQRHNDIQVDFRCSMRPPDVGSMEVDVAVQLDRPIDPELKVKRLGWLHVVLFASQDYIDRHGYLPTKKDLDKHNFIEIVAEQIQSDRVEKEMTSANKRSFVGLRVNTGSAQLLAVTHGAGITALPTYTLILSNGLRHVAPDFELKRDIWLVYHPRAAEFGHVRKTIDWIKNSFDPNRYPWFQEEFVPPEAIDAFIRERGMERMFASFRE
jgi:DNA-binding transcriptional LysR family regulator